MAIDRDLHILVVDESSIWRTFITYSLLGVGIRSVYVAYDGIQAVIKARTLQPDVILMDVSLPHMDGIAAATAIRESVPSAKVIFLSANSDPDVKKAAMSAGACGYVLKSLVHGELIAAIQRAVPKFES